MAAQIAQIKMEQRLDAAQKQAFKAEINERKKRLLKAIREQPFDMATQWSVPPIESLRMAIPGLYCYRENPHGWMNHPVEGKERYWGRVGQRDEGLVRRRRSHRRSEVGRRPKFQRSVQRVGWHLRLYRSIGGERRQ